MIVSVIPHNDIPKISDFSPKLKAVQLDPAKLNQFIQDHGVRVRVFKTMLCPNVKHADAGDHEIKCTTCTRGFIDKHPVETWAAMQNQTLIKNFSKDGVWDDQLVAATFISGIDLNYFSKIELLDFTTTFFERVQKQEGTVDRLKYPAVKINMLIDKHGVEYKAEKHFNITPTGDIEWINPIERPAIGVVYSVHYDYKITFRAINALHVNRFSQHTFKQKFRVPVEYAQQWILKRDFLITKEDVNGSPLSPNKIIDADPTIV